MWNIIKRLIPASERLDTSEQNLVSQSLIQGLRLELAETQQALAETRLELDRQQKFNNATAKENTAIEMENFLRSISAPITQLNTQLHISEKQNKPVAIRDIMQVIKHLLHLLQDFGLEITVDIGQNTAYNPNLHVILSSQESIVPGEPVVIRFAGLAYQNRMICKAGVTRIESIHEN